MNFLTNYDQLFDKKNRYNVLRNIVFPNDIKLKFCCIVDILFSRVNILIYIAVEWTAVAYSI